MRARRILAVVLLAAFAAPAQAAYPEKPIRFVVPSASGGSVDVLMRILTQQLPAQMGVAFAVENQPGGSDVPGTLASLKAAPDRTPLHHLPLQLPPPHPPPHPPRSNPVH